MVPSDNTVNHITEWQGLSRSDDLRLLYLKVVINIWCTHQRLQCLHRESCKVNRVRLTSLGRGVRRSEDLRTTEAHFFLAFFNPYIIHSLVIADLGHWGLIPNGPGRQWPYRLVRAIGDPIKISNFSVCLLISRYFEKVFITRERLTPILKTSPSKMEEMRMHLFSLTRPVQLSVTYWLTDWLTNWLTD